MMLINLLTHVGILLVMLSRVIMFVNSDESDDAHYESDEYHDREDESNRDGELTRLPDRI